MLCQHLSLHLYFNIRLNENIKEDVVYQIQGIVSTIEHPRIPYVIESFDLL